MSAARRPRPLRALGHFFTVCADDPRMDDELADAFADLADPRGGPAAHGAAPTRYVVRRHGRRWAVSADETELVSDAPRHEAPQWVAWHVNRCAVASCTDALVLHACAAVVDGVTVVASGESGAGKTTLAAGLLAGGAAYLTDEAVPIERAGLRATAFPKPLSLFADSWHLVPAALGPAPTEGETLVRASALGQVQSADGPPPRLLLAVRYAPGDGAPPRPVSRAELGFRLAGTAFNFTAAVADNLTTLGALLGRAGCYVLDTDDTRSSVEQIRTLVGGLEPAEVHSPPDVTEEDGLVTLVIDDEALVFATATGSLHHLDPVSLSTWTALRGGRPVSDVIAELAAAYPADGERVDADIRALVARLVDEGLVPA